jgi:hypothetical protein
MRHSVLVAPALVAALAAAEEAPPRKLVFNIDFALSHVEDKSLRRSMGRERVTKIPYAILGASGDLSPHLSYRLEANAVNDSMKPEPFLPSEKTPFFFPNLADTAYGVSSKPEGQFKVDDYKNTGLDPYIQEHNLRRAFIDVHTRARRVGLIAGRFFVPIGLALEDVRWLTAKDLTHIQRINNRTDTGAEAYYAFGHEGSFHGRASAAVVGGNGNPYHDYVYFDFTRSTAEDTNSAVGSIVTLRLSPVAGMSLSASYEYNFVGSRIETDTTLQRSKHYDNKLVLAARYRPGPLRYVELFGELARYKWGLRDTSIGLLPGPPTKTPIFKEGYYVGADVRVPLKRPRGALGVVVTREELDRDDSLVAFMAARDLLGVTLGKKERSTIVKVYADTDYVSLFFFRNSLSNPFPQASAIVPISGPFAFMSSGDSKLGFGFRLRASF